MGLRGPEEANQKMSDWRAESLSEYFSHYPDVHSRMRFKGYGESNPILTWGDLDELYDNCGNKLDKNDPRQNRRTELLVVK